MVRRAGRSRVRRKKGAIESALHRPAARLRRRLPRRDGAGERQELPRPQPWSEPTGRAAGRAKQEIDYGRRGKGYIFGAFRPATGEALTRPYPSRSTANWVDFLEQVERGCRPRASGCTRSSTT